MPQKRSCPDCQTNLNRREFARITGAAAVAAGAAAWLPGFAVHANPTPSSTAETAVARFYQTLQGSQKEAICFPFEHELRTRLSANWHISKPLIGSDFYSPEQRELIHEILKGVTSPDGYDRFIRQMDDDSGGISDYSVAIFGEPGSNQFQWEMTGRHLTVRADGDSVANMAFGGPIVYGHGEESSPSNNLFHYQTRKVNEIFGALEGQQREKALIATAPEENDVALQGDSGKFPGLAVSDLSADQKSLFEEVFKTILAPYRQEDVDEVLAILKQTGGIDKLHLAFYKEGDLEDDKVWDIWRVEGPSFVWHFRGAPHVHAYVNIGVKS